jgi:hypothetical protein
MVKKTMPLKNQHPLEKSPAIGAIGAFYKSIRSPWVTPTKTTAITGAPPRPGSCCIKSTKAWHSEALRSSWRVRMVIYTVIN